MFQPICVVGTVATQPKEISFESGVYLCSFALASNFRRFDKGASTWVDSHTNWFTVNVFRSLGENAFASISKGDRLIIKGRLRIKKWERDGKSGTNVEIDADAIGHELKWGTTKFTRATRVNGADGELNQSEISATEPSENSNSWFDGKPSNAEEEINTPF